jgi:hypothetical protein
MTFFSFDIQPQNDDVTAPAHFSERLQELWDFHDQLYD